MSMLEAIQTLKICSLKLKLQNFSPGSAGVKSINGSLSGSQLSGEVRTYIIYEVPSIMNMMFRARPQTWTGTTSTWWCGCGPSATRSSATTMRASSSSRERGRYGSVSDYSASI